MKPSFFTRHRRVLIGLGTATAFSLGLAATVMSFKSAVNVSNTPGATEKAKAARLAFQSGLEFRKAWLYTYSDAGAGNGPANVYARSSFDEGQSWSAPVLLSRDAQGLATGGQQITTAGGFITAADNGKPSLAAPPVTSGPRVLISWTSSYCPQDPVTGSAGHSGNYASAVQGQSSLTSGAAVDHPFHCVWVATSTDPQLLEWQSTQLTDGTRDAIGDVPASNATGTGFALAWQEDPAGLKPGEAEGPGDGGSGATVSAGTNIWYSHATATDGTQLRTHVRQASDNNSTATGAPGASRPNLAISGNTAVLAYEESACAGGSTGKCIVHHGFALSAPPFSQAPGAAGDPGSVMSDPSRNARRVRVALQGASAAPTSGLRSLLLWRESASQAGEGAPADIMIRRGFAHASGEGSDGYASADLLADTPKAITSGAEAGANANAHRALLRNNLIALAYDQTPSMAAADPARTQPPTATYNLYLARSTDSGASWTPARNLSRLTQAGLRVVEPRLVPTAGTVFNPLTGNPDPGDTQNTQVFFVAYGVENNDTQGTGGRIYLSRTSDQGQTFEPFVPVPGGPGAQSEAQLRVAPDGASVGVLWMQEQTPADTLSRDAMFAAAQPSTLATPVASGGGCTVSSGQATTDPLLPLMLALGVVGWLSRPRRQRGDPAADAPKAP
jgi:hypothetical protein